MSRFGDGRVEGGPLALRSLSPSAATSFANCAGDIGLLSESGGGTKKPFTEAKSLNLHVTWILPSLGAFESPFTVLLSLMVNQASRTIWG